MFPAAQVQLRVTEPLRPMTAGCPPIRRHFNAVASDPFGGNFSLPGFMIGLEEIAAAARPLAAYAPYMTRCAHVTNS